MESLYEIAGNIEMLMNMIDENEDEFSDECLFDTWESLEMAFDDKAENWCKCIKNLEKNAEIAEAEADRLKTRAKNLKNRAAKMKSVLAYLIIKAGRESVKTPLFTVNRIKLNGRLEVDANSKVSDEFKKEAVKKTMEADKDKIRTALENGKKLPFARFYNSCTIS